MVKLIAWLESFINLIYPRICAGCGRNLYRAEDTICTHCLMNIPITGFEEVRDNHVIKLFWGRVKIEHATSLFYYEKSTTYQHLIQNFKYKGIQKIGTILGNYLGRQLENTEFSKVDAIIPIPLHKVKQHQRGFNQSEVIANGIGEILSKPVQTNVVERIKHTSTQTSKSRYDRWKNIQEVFQCKKPENLENKHILLVDDIITTGATIESLAEELLKIKGVKVSVATLAVALN